MTIKSRVSGEEADKEIRGDDSELPGVRTGLLGLVFFIFYAKGVVPLILMIDNYDSFVYNLVQYLREMGEEVVVRRNDSISLADIGEMAPERIIISPGPCSPDEAGISLEVVSRFAGRIPILGVCLGHQAIGQVFGGHVVRADKPMHGKTSLINHDGKGVFGGLPAPLVVGRYHSLLVEEETLPACLEVTARTAAGEIMGLRHREYSVEGVQFHPESILTPDGKRMLANFLGIGEGCTGAASA